MPNDFNQQIIDEFRANGGSVGGPFEGGRLLLLTTTGARSGARHTTPLAYLPDGAGRVLVIASAGGAPKHPDWFRNLVARPRATVEAGVFTYEAEAVVLEGAERDAAFARAVEGNPGWADYQARTERVIPVVALDEIPGPPDIRADSFGAAVKAVHDGFRRELALIRKELGEQAAGGPSTDTGTETGPGIGIGAQLRVNCLTVCQGLHFHHTGEDTGMFPLLADRRPELTPVLDRLREEHERIAALIGELQEVVTAEGVDAVQVRAEVERLTDELESHLLYEEEQLVPALDAMHT
ncbi:nitroreductase/quinone reductase family protein [Streptomyces formicae]|uniref:Nitroreductase family deazaflavin-dependent oxidoreductase n=1 Tax=Streptomyces formicae TaxID=1616117 RepID=A0ABY3X015_9ACTN|nr:nitroreductase/quinone reductase family protein [Streptomyces formicae]UNM16086.1 nitroreductase family deazaflavin-dependent oxidoreductase [Streptomyces formicae]